MTQFGQCDVRGGLRGKRNRLLSLMGRTLYFHWTGFILIPTSCGSLLQSTWLTSSESRPVGLGSFLDDSKAGSTVWWHLAAAAPRARGREPQGTAVQARHT